MAEKKSKRFYTVYPIYQIEMLNKRGDPQKAKLGEMICDIGKLTIGPNEPI
jgi:hypothetical protein